MTDKKDKKEITSIAVSKKTHQKLKIEAAKKGKGVTELAEEIINKAIPNGNNG